MMPPSTDRTKVAIIDSGADLGHEDLADNIVFGSSFVESEPADGASSWPLPWYTSADKHGTQMASLVRAVDKSSALYIYRISSLGTASIGIANACAVSLHE
jgi:subtilisin family serine protease